MSGFVTLQSGTPMNPPNLLVPVTDDPIFTVKRLFLCYYFLEVIQHLLAITGMYEIRPLLKRPLIVNGNVKDPVEN